MAHRIAIVVCCLSLFFFFFFQRLFRFIFAAKSHGNRFKPDD